MARIDDILAGIMKGAQEAGAAVEQHTVGHEEKLANMAGIGGAIAGPIGAALGADKGHRTDAAAGSVAGGALGGMTGSGLGQLIGLIARNPQLGQQLSRGLGTGGAIAGSAMGADHYGTAPTMQDRALGLLDKVRGKFSSAEDAYLAGSKQAAERYKIALAPLLGMAASMAAPALARFGLGRIAGGALGRMGGGALGRAAGGMLNFAKKPVGGAMFDMGTSMAAQSATS